MSVLMVNIYNEEVCLIAKSVISNPDIVSSISLSQFLCLYMTASLCSVAVARIKYVHAFSELCTVPGINECAFRVNNFF